MRDSADERHVLRAGLAELQYATAMPVVFGGFVADGLLPLAEFRGTRTEALRGVVVRCGGGLGGRVAAQAQPLAVTDYFGERKISHEYDPVVAREGLRSMAAVPVVVGRSVAAVLYAGLRRTDPVGDRTLGAAMAVARRVAHELAVAREVERRVAQVAQAEREVLSVAAREGVREAYAELRAIAMGVDDVDLRSRLEKVGTLLAWAREGVAPAPVVRLSSREVDTLALVAVGCSNAEAAERLGVSRETVKSYLRSASRKLGASGRTEAVVLARRAGALP